MHIELLGQHTADASGSAGKVDVHNDPYVIKRGIRYRLHKQVLEENNNRHDLLAVQDSFQQFEAHVIQTIQQAMAAFYQNVGGQAERQKAMYTDMVETTQSIPPDFEWRGFVQRNNALLLDPSAPQRDVSHITFPNQDHPSTQPLIAGRLERKSRAAMKGYSSGYFVVTRGKFLHEFKDDNDFHHDPTPELSLYLPDCNVGALAGNEFHVKGKDVSKGKIANVIAMSHELEFKATSDAAQRWWGIIHELAGSGGGAAGSVPVSPVDNKNISGQHPPPQNNDHRNVAPVQTQGLPQHQTGPTSGTTTATSGYGGTSVPSSATATNQPYNTPISATGLHGGPGNTGIAPGAVPPRS